MIVDRIKLGPLIFWGFLVFIGVISTRWLIVDNYSVDFPFHDQWRAEGLEVFLPMYEGTFERKDWFKAWNQHRIVLHRLWSTAIFHLNGQWDNQLQATANALWPALSAVLLMFWIYRIGGSRFMVPGTIVAWAFFALPFTWENMLWGFQSQFHFLVLFSLLGMSCLAVATIGSVYWIFGTIALCLALFSMGSGWVAALSIFFISALSMVLSRNDVRKLWPSVLVCALIVMSGFLLNDGTPPVERLSIRYLVLSLLHYLAWPLPGNFTALLLWFPWFALLAMVVMRRVTLDASSRFILMLGLWSGLQATGLVMLNFMRWDNWHILARASKYTELLMFHAVAALLAVVYLYGRTEVFHSKRVSRKLIPTAWFILITAGFVVTTFEAWRFAGRSLLADFAVWRPEVRAVLRDHDEQIQRGSSDGLLACLRNDYLKSILPLSVRSSLPVEATFNSGFVEQGYDPRFDKPLWYDEAVYGSYRSVVEEAGATFVSEIIHPGPLPLLVFPLAGVKKGQNDGMFVHLEEVESGRRTPVLTRYAMWRGWSMAWVQRPDKPYRIVIEDKHPLTWIAFQMPREAGYGTLAGVQLRESSIYLFSIFCASLLAVICFFGAKKHCISG